MVFSSISLSSPLQNLIFCITVYTVTERNGPYIVYHILRATVDYTGTLTYYIF